MTGTSTGSVSFRLPRQWTAADPPAPDEVFLAVVPDTDDPVTPCLTVQLSRSTEPVAMTSVADDALRTMREAGLEPVVHSRRHPGDGSATVQTVRFTASAAGRRHDMMQSLGYLSVLDVVDGSVVGHLRVTLTTSAERHGEYYGDFAELADSVRVVDGSEAIAVVLDPGPSR